MSWGTIAALPVIDLAQPCLPTNLDLLGNELVDRVQCGTQEQNNIQEANSFF